VYDTPELAERWVRRVGCARLCGILQGEHVVKTGGDDEIMEALSLCFAGENELLVGNATMTSTTQGVLGPLDGPGEFTWVHPDYETIVESLSKAMVKLGYDEGRESELIADVYLFGFVRGIVINRLQKAARKERKGKAVK
jgi:hypothetical protein